MRQKGGATGGVTEGTNTQICHQSDPEKSFITQPEKKKKRRRDVSAKTRGSSHQQHIERDRKARAWRLGKTCPLQATLAARTQQKKKVGYFEEIGGKSGCRNAGTAKASAMLQALRIGSSVACQAEGEKGPEKERKTQTLLRKTQDAAAISRRLSLSENLT